MPPFTSTNQQRWHFFDCSAIITLAQSDRAFANREYGDLAMAISTRRPSAFRKVGAASRAAVQRRPRLGRPTAFTLVELLVVITIIGMLVALLLPAVQNARERGRQVTCLNNMKNIGLAAFSYDSSKGQVPGLMQFIKRGPKEWASIDYDAPSRKFKVISKTFNQAPDLTQVSGFSWATMLLSKIERSDIWDQINSPPRESNGNPQDVLIPPINTFVCPSDQDVTTQPDLPGLSYSANSGGWDPRTTGSQSQLIVNATAGDTAENGVFHDIAGYDRIGAKAPKVRLSNINDGSGTTLMLAENIHKTYDSTSPSGAPAFGWLFGNYEQQLGFVWVVPTSGTSPAQPVGNSVNDQEPLNRADAVTFPPDIPRYARPAGPHKNGVNVAYCDGHSDFLRDDIDYLVYQQLMTPWGRKCDDPASHRGSNTAVLPNTDPIKLFRNAAPLTEKDYK
jgi:prepilin-type processing-associated H-X9-DG protein